MRKIEKLALEEPMIFQVFEAFRREEKKLGEHVKIRWFKDHWEINIDWEKQCSDKEFLSVLKIETIRLMLHHPFADRSKDSPNAWLASNAVIYDNYDCKKCKMKKIGCESDCPFTYITPTPDEMDWENEAGFESGLPFEGYIGNLTPHKSSTLKGIDSLNEILSMMSENDEKNEWKPPKSEEEEQEERDRQACEDKQTEIADSAEQNSEGWGNSEHSDLIEHKIKDIIKRHGLSSNWGSMPSGLIEEIIREEVFKQDLSRFVRVVNGRISIGYKSTRLRINRRVEQFSGHKRTLGAKVLIALDTSGSMSSDDLKRTFDVIESLKYKAQLWISYCDTKVSEPIKLKENIQKLQARGRGGTDLNPVLKYSDDFDFTIIITDGYMAELQTTLRQERTIGILFANEELYNEHVKNRAWNKFLCGFVRTKR